MARTAFVFGGGANASKMLALPGTVDGRAYITAAKEVDGVSHMMTTGEAAAEISEQFGRTVKAWMICRLYALGRVRNAEKFGFKWIVRPSHYPEIISGLRLNGWLPTEGK